MKYLASLSLVGVIFPAAVHAAAPDVQQVAAADFAEMSIEDLAKVEISSVSKKAEPLDQAAAAVYVITRDDILRAGANSIPEMLRLAPNLEVAQINASAYAISAHGFNSALANKLLVLIDGRSVYSPLYAGVYWDMQNVPPEDIERIEVISGPGATLWGANAVNGVINIITRKSDDTLGGVLDIAAGDRDQRANLQYGGRLTDDLTYRVYASDVWNKGSVTPGGANAGNKWSIPQGGFRLDWTRSDDAVTFQGDFYSGAEKQPLTLAQSVSGLNLLGRWQHRFSDTSSLQVQTYYDKTHRFDTGGFTINTYDLDIQHTLSLGRNELVWGGGYRAVWYNLTNVSVFGLLPVHRTLNLGDVFIQDTLALSPSVRLTVGTKVEDDPFSGVAPLPSGRISWNVTERMMVWSAVSRAVRAPTPFDTDVFEKTGSLLFLVGNPHFDSEKLTAYEAGTRVRVSNTLSFSLSGFYNVYDDLRSIEPSPVTIFPLVFGNLMGGHVYGLEGWGNYQLTHWWRLSAGFNVQHESLRFAPQSSGLGGIQQAGNDPEHQVSVRSSMNVTDSVLLDADVRYVGPLPNPAAGGYVELNAKLGWNATKQLDLSIAGMNLLHRRHVEFIGSASTAIPRSVVAEARWRF